MSERRSNYRGRAQADRRLPLRWRSASDGADWHDSEARDVGNGGCFITTAGAPPEVGTALRLELRIPTADRGFEISAIVRWHKDGGMGVQFPDLDVDVRSELTDYFASLTGGG